MEYCARVSDGEQISGLSLCDRRMGEVRNKWGSNNLGMARWARGVLFTSLF